MPAQLLPPGTPIANKLRIIRTLGVGGMGTVYEAVHLHLRRKVAVKLIHPGQSESREARLRFIREAQALASLPLDHIVQVLDVDVLPWGGLYMVLELLDGRDLKRELVKRRTLPVGEAVMYILQACRGVAAAHAAGIVHRDLKPQNLFLTHLDGERRLKLLDFGIAKISDGSEQALTESSVTLGTPLYMAPEQLDAANHVDERADIWALGVVLYELLAGKTPFRCGTSAATMAAICFGEVPRLHRLRDDVPSELEAVIDRCLHKDRESRLGSAEELASALEPFTTTTGLISLSLQVPRGSSAPPAAGSLIPSEEEFELHSKELAEQALVAGLENTVGVPAAPDSTVASTSSGLETTRHVVPAATVAPRERRLRPAIVAVLVTAAVALCVALAMRREHRDTAAAPSAAVAARSDASSPAPAADTTSAALLAESPTPQPSPLASSSARPSPRVRTPRGAVAPNGSSTPRSEAQLAGDAVPLTL